MNTQAKQLRLQSGSQPTLLGRAARMALVFLLVFGLSFRVEMALAASDVATSDLDDHKQGELYDLVVCKVVSNTAGKTKEKVDVSKEGRVRSLTNMSKDEKKDGLTLEYGESVKLAAAPKWKDASDFDATAAKYVEWKIDGEDQKNKNGKFEPVLEITNEGTTAGSSGKTIEVTCSLSKDAQDYLKDGLTKTSITFPVKLEAEKPTETHKVVSQPKIVLTGKGLAEGNNNLELTLEQGKNYQFGAKVTATILTVDANEKTVSTGPFTYSSESKVGLSVASEGLFDDLQWTLCDTKDKNALDKSIATIDQSGLLKVSKDSEFLVQCALNTPDPDSPDEVFELTVTCGNPNGSGQPDNPDKPDNPENPNNPDNPADKKPDQGADHRQDSLQITGRVATAALASGVMAADPPESTEGSNGGNGVNGANGENGEKNQEEAQTPPASESGKSDVTTLDKTYSLSEIEALPSTEQTFTVNTIASGALTVTGKGLSLEALFKNLGIENLDGIYQLKFTDYAKGEVTLDWKDLADAMVAVKSFVHDSAKGAPKNGSPTASTASGSEASAKVTLNSDEANNTRFRILAKSLSSGKVDADSLRWIKSIEINPGSMPEFTPEPEPEPDPEPEPEPEPEAPFTVSVGYAPSPIGQECVFWPIPSKEIANATFDYTWEESADGGKTWKTVSESPTYRTITTEKRIGHQFRVILASDMKDEATGKKLRAISEPESMKEGSGFSLIYDPPLAGGVAMFIVQMSGKIPNLNINKLDYIWELSNDGCKTWQKLASQYQGKSTLSIQTDPVDEDDSSNSDITPVYIRARVIEKTGDERAFIAGPQMLTVRTGDEAGSGDDKKNQAPENAVPVKPVKDDPNKTDSSNKTDKKKSKKKQKKTELKENDDPKEGEEEFEYNDEGDDNEETKVPSERGSKEKKQAAPELHINDAITEQILEQEAAVQERMEQTVPGARWTSLNMTQASGDDVRNILAENPFAPFAIPIGLGITVAGGLEKLLAFRRQL